MAELLPWVEPAAIAAAVPREIDADCRERAAAIVAEVRDGGEAALRRCAERYGDLEPGGALWHDHADLRAALARLAAADRALLERAAGRIRAFAEAQRRALLDVTVPLPGGAAGHTVAPVERAGCYAPGGRYPLPSSVLMTAVTARAAGVADVVVASPRPATVTLAAAAVAGADGVLAAGGAHAIAALAFGVGPLARRDVVVGPGNRWVTAAKLAIVGQVGIDMLAGPSELCCVADDGADADAIAADLIAQAEHDPDARPILIATSRALVEQVRDRLAWRLVRLPTAAIAKLALARGAATAVPDLPAALALADTLAPEHLQIAARDDVSAVDRARHYGAVFVGDGGAEVLGDYAAGPNHVLPTGGAARYRGGLSVLDFVRIRTWLRIDEPPRARELFADAARLAELEGLPGHAEAARLRLSLAPRDPPGS
jgi:phosphoribosyl-ATP pyrophosphohydrolase/phosphoribosyl-AMP cyclohydrolase/histidinol dehydrogenase